MISEKTTSIRTFDYEKYLQKAINYSQYKQEMAEDLVSNPDDKIKAYIKLNQTRMQRVEKTYTVSLSLRERLRTLKQKTWWLVLTENWCGDAAQNLPVLNAIAELSEGKIEMKLLYRDQNPALMDAFLTNGTRSIPKLIQLDGDFKVTGTWGPRPAVAQELVKQLRADPLTAPHYGHELHLWYAKDRQQEVEAEISQLLLTGA